MKKAMFIASVLALSLFGTHPATATDLYPWQNHAAPFTFLFGNDFDSHQQTERVNGNLFGFFYIHFTGAVTRDDYRVATHVDCNSEACTVGWILDGKPRKATFLYQSGTDHPVFLIARPDIPEPGAFAHFHWLGDDLVQGETKSGYLLQLTAVDTFCFVHDAAENTSRHKSCRHQTCRDLGGVVVKPGIDIATHLNIVTSAPQ